ncbi:hypothetical protein, partial [Rubrivirga sp.]|uniref:hypothetical protein n=1 Tax=Rubrivirga sp. TaxID=1885344 RepID=UPI003C7717EF
QPVDAEALRALLPAEIGGVPRSEAEVAADSALGVSISQAEGRYAFEGGSYVVRFTDYADLETMGIMGLGWIQADFDRQAGAASERTVEVDGRRGFRRYDPSSRSGEFSVAVADRFHVRVTGTGVDDDDLEAALGTVDLEALAGLQDAGRPEPGA